MKMPRQLSLYIHQQGFKAQTPKNAYNGSQQATIMESEKTQPKGG